MNVLLKSIVIFYRAAVYNFSSFILLFFHANTLCSRLFNFDNYVTNIIDSRLSGTSQYNTNGFCNLDVLIMCSISSNKSEI